MCRRGHGMKSAAGSPLGSPRVLRGRSREACCTRRHRFLWGSCSYPRRWPLWTLTGALPRHSPTLPLDFGEMPRNTTGDLRCSAATHRLNGAHMVGRVKEALNWAKRMTQQAADEAKNATDTPEVAADQYPLPHLANCPLRHAGPATTRPSVRPAGTLAGTRDGERPEEGGR